MACNLRLFLVIAFLACSLDYYKAKALSPRLASISTLVARLKLDEESPSCWDSLTQLQACTGEIITFFLNGEAYLGHGCCQALRAIGEQCWPNMIDTLGFTAEEGQILEGYCDKTDHPSSPSQPSVVPSNRVVPKQSLVIPWVVWWVEFWTGHSWPIIITTIIWSSSFMVVCWMSICVIWVIFAMVWKINSELSLLVWVWTIFVIKES